MKSRTNEVSWAKRARCQSDSWEDESCYDLKENVYLSGWAGGKAQRFSDLEKAKNACFNLKAKCGGITLQFGKYGLRAGKVFKKSPSREVSFRRKDKCVAKCKQVTFFSECFYRGKHLEVINKANCLKWQPKSICIPENRRVTLNNMCDFKGKKAIFSNSVDCVSDINFKLLEAHGIQVIEKGSFLQ